MHEIKSRGFSLLELVVVLLVLGIIATSIGSGYLAAVRYLPQIHQQDLASSLAQGRMAFIQGQFQIAGFDQAEDLCADQSTLPICDTPTGYTVTSIITDNYDNDSNMKLIEVTVSGDGSATATSLEANHK